MAIKIDEKENKLKKAKEGLGSANSIAKLRDEVVANLIEEVEQLKKKIEKMK